MKREKGEKKRENEQKKDTELEKCHKTNISYSGNNSDLVSHHAALGGLAQQAPEGDDGRHAGTVEEEKGSQTLQADGVGVVGQIVGGLPLDVQDEAAKYPVTVTAVQWIMCKCLISSLATTALSIRTSKGR